MAVSVGTLQPLPSSSCERPHYHTIFRQSSSIRGIPKLLLHLECRICCSLKRTTTCAFKKQYRQPFRSSTIEDAVITSWVLYNYDTRRANPSKPISYNSEPSSYDETTEVAAEDQRAGVLVAAEAQGMAGRKGRGNPRASNPSLSISQSFDGQSNGGYIMQATGPPDAALTKPLAGGAGLYMALVFALLGMTTAGASLLGISSSQEECTKCSGYGVERCHLCQCTGTIKFEGHFVRTIPCPLCLGSQMKKCSGCDGVRIKKGVPPFLQEELAKYSRRSNK